MNPQIPMDTLVVVLLEAEYPAKNGELPGEIYLTVRVADGDILYSKKGIES
jgi:hypothetical protein